MKTVTVREAAGGIAEIRRRKTPVVRIVPMEHPAEWGDPVDWEGHEDLMTSVWRGASVEQGEAVLDDLRGR